jgi:hypothetical protein
MLSVSARLHPSIYPLHVKKDTVPQVPYCTAVLTGITLARGSRHESGVTRQAKLSPSTALFIEYGRNAEREKHSFLSP